MIDSVLSAVDVDVSTVSRLVLALVLSMLIGWEREAKHKDAGLRTHMLVGLGSCAFMLVALALSENLSANDDSVSIDPSRVIQGLIGGIGFLGAGAIIHGGGDEVRGLTTGAGIWLVGAIGLACGAGSYGLAIVITILAIVIMLFCGWFAKPLVDDLSNSSDESR